MYNENLENEKIVVEIRDLISDIDQVQETVDTYCKFLKDMFLSGSGRN